MNLFSLSLSFSSLASKTNKTLFHQFDAAYAATIGIDFLSKTMYLEDRTVRLQRAGEPHKRLLHNVEVPRPHLDVVLWGGQGVGCRKAGGQAGGEQAGCVRC